MRERTITIDMDEGNYRILRYKQYDNNNILKIIIQENKEEVNLSMYTARLFFKLPSNIILEKDTVIKNNQIIVTIDSGILSESGRIKVDLTLSSSDQLVSAFTMYFDVEETIDRNEAVQSKPEWDLITNTLNNLDTKVDKVEGKSLIANTEIERLANVDNYDDTELRNLIDTKSDIGHNHDTQYANKSTEHIHDNKSILDIITIEKIGEWNDKSDFSGSYNDLTDKPKIPTVDVNKSYVDEQLENKSDIGHTHTELHVHNNKDILDTITQNKINEWNNHFSGDYNDLINKPTIPSLDGYATENYVKNAIVDAQLNGGGGTGSVDLSGYATKDELNAKANVSDIPTKTSQLQNDSKFLTSVPSEYITETELNAKGYLTQHQDISGKVDKVSGKSLISNTEIERLANMEDYANNYTHPSTHNASIIKEDSTHRFITDLERINWNNKVDENQLHNHSNKDILDTITSDKITNWNNAEANIQSDWNETNDTSDAYIKNKPSIPTKVSELTNDRTYATETYVQNKIAEAQVGGSVDLSSYALKVDLNEKVDKVSGKGLSTNDYTTAEKNKLANLSTVATSGSYNDLTDKPKIPTKTSELTNDSSFASESYVTNAINNAQLGGGSGSGVDLSNYQTKSDNTLNTTDKTIVGAINELETNKANKTYVDEQVANISVDLSDYQTKTDTTLGTTNKTIVGAINELKSNVNELFQNVSSGKTLIASAITDKGIKTSSDATFQTMADNIRLIEGNEGLPSWLKKTVWLKCNDFSYYICNHCSCVIDNNIYIIGGLINTVSSTSYVKSAHCDYYNTDTNENISITSMPSNKESFTVSSIDNCIYSIGGVGYNIADKNECFDITNDQGWIEKTSMLSKRYNLTSSVVNNKIYCIGGNVYRTTTNAGTTGANECYDPVTDTWTTKTDMPNRRYSLTSSVVDNKIYCIGGEHATLNQRNINEEYDPSTDSWTTKAEMTTHRANLSSSVVDNKIYCIGGGENSSVFDTNECYDPLTNSWTTKSSIKTTLKESIAETVGNCIYIIGGRNNDSYLLNTNYCYMPNNDN